MVLENVKEMWTETPRTSGGKKGRPVNKDRFISKMWVTTIVKSYNWPRQRPSSLTVKSLLICAC